MFPIASATTASGMLCCGRCQPREAAAVQGEPRTSLTGMGRVSGEKPNILPFRAFSVKGERPSVRMHEAPRRIK